MKEKPAEEYWKRAWLEEPAGRCFGAQEAGLLEESEPLPEESYLAAAWVPDLPAWILVRAK
jgi:hypothetical protein